MGLLGNGWEDPQSSAIMALAGGLLRGDFGGGLLGANDAFAQHKANALKTQMAQMQMDELRAQTQERTLKAQREQEAMDLARRKQAALPRLFGSGMMPAQPGQIGSGSFGALPAPAGGDMPQRQPGSGQFDVQAAIRAGFTPKEIMDYAALRNANQDEVARVLTEQGPGGAKIEQQYDKFGRKVGPAVNGYVAPQLVNQGDRQTFVQPVAGTSLPMNMSFADKNAAAQLGLSRQRLEFDQSQSQVAKPQFHDGQWVYPPSAQNPQGATVPAAGYTKQMGEGGKKQVVGIDSLHTAIDEYKRELAGWSATDALKPDKRAAMGTAYNNMMLQAKEAYNLGVLNGPDFQILTSTITDPRSLTGAITSNSALTKQATELDRFMQRTRKAVVNQGAGGGASGGWSIQKVN